MTRWAGQDRWGAAFVAAYIGLLALYTYVGFTSPGFDDEFFTIRWIEEFGSGVIGYSQQRDVNPPGSYAVIWLLYSLLGSWSLVRLVISLLAAASIVYAVARVRHSHGDVRGLIAVFLLGLSPALLMWTTSLRWYALFVPVLVLLSFPPRPNSWRYWATYFGGLLVLGYLSYAMFIIAVPLGYVYWRADPRPTRVKVTAMAVFGLLFAALYAHQMSVFLTQHLSRDASQRFPLIDGLIGFGVAALSNQGVFPLSIGGVAAIVGTIAALALIGLTALRENLTRNTFFTPYWIGVLLLILSGLAGKFRNFVVITPWQSLFLAQAIIPAKWLRAFLACVALISVGNIAGVVNVVSHTNTSKSGWNLPVSQVMAAVDEANSTCNQDIVVVAHDPALTYTLEARGYDVVSLWSTRTDLVAATNRTPECVVALKTYSGSREQVALRLQTAVEAIDAESASSQLIGYDSTYATKRLIEPDYPEYQVEMLTLRSPAELRPLQELLPPRARPQSQAPVTP